jgi:PAP2 superfamily
MGRHRDLARISRIGRRCLEACASSQTFLNGFPAWIRQKGGAREYCHGNIGYSWVSGRVAETVRALARGFISHRWLYAVAAIAQISALAQSLYLGRPFDIRLVLFSFRIVLATAAAAALYLTIKELWRTRHERSATVALGRLVIHDFLGPERLANIVHSTIPTSFFMSAFLMLKAYLPEIHPFQWDPTFLEWDRALHFGFHAYQLLQPALGHPYVTKALNTAYNAWFFFMLIAWVVTAYARRDTPLRQRYMLAFTLCWFIGTNVLGTIFSSVGPCYYGRLLSGDDPFQPLMAYLHQADAITMISALRTQDMLWQGYLGSEGMVRGISAMPSMHVAMCVLLAVLGFASGRRWLGWFFAAFTATIFLGSIELAWHYAIDGYAGAAIALASWYFAGRDAPEPVFARA